MTYYLLAIIIFKIGSLAEIGLKKILIISHTMELGGAERALLGLLNNIDTSKYSVDLFLERHFGELLEYIPPNINVLNEEKHYACTCVPAKEVLKNGCFGVAFGRYIGKKKATDFVKNTSYKSGSDVFINYSQKYTYKYMPMISNKEYDLVISFLTPHYYALHKTKAKEKIAWIHTDYSAVEIDRESELEMWSGFDRIISISDDVSKSFLKVFPELDGKLTVIKNMHPSQFIKEKSLEFDASGEMPRDGSIRLLSIGRFCTAKNFDNLPYICKYLIKKHNLNVKWYIIGYGTDTELIKNSIEKSGMRDSVILLGKKSNPYPYIKECDFYIQPSRFEGNAVTVNEALILEKKVAVTNYLTAHSQIKNGYDGVIVPMENESCADGIFDFIKDIDLQKKIVQNIKNEDYSFKTETEKIYELIG